MHRIESFIQKIFGAFRGMRLSASKRVATSSDTMEGILAETIRHLEDIQRKQDSIMMTLRDLVESRKGIDDARSQLEEL